MSERYLPGPPAKNKGALLTILVIVGIALVASASFTIFGVAFQWTTMFMVAGIFGFAMFGGFMAWFLWSASRFYADTDGALVALGRGEFDRAAEVWSRWAGRRAPEMVRAAAAHNLGWTVIRQGELRRAIEILGRNDHRCRTGLESAHLAATTAQDLALCYALTGDLEAAQAWFDESGRRWTRKAPTTYNAMKAFTHAVLDCRAGRTDDAARDLAEGWSAFERITPDLLRPMRVVRAFAEDPKKAPGIVASSRPAFRGEYDFLAVDWPEMAAFLTRHDLARTR